MSVCLELDSITFFINNFKFQTLESCINFKKVGEIFFGLFKLNPKVNFTQDSI